MADVVFLETVQQFRDRDLCRVVEIMYELGKTVLVHTLSTAGASHFDNLLWTFHKESFVPHRIGRPEAPEDMALERVIIVVNELPTPIAGDVLIFAEEVIVRSRKVGHCGKMRQDWALSYIMYHVGKEKDGGKYWRNL